MKNLFELKDYEEFNNTLIDPPDSDTDSDAICDWLVAHEIVISVGGKVITLPYNADNVSELQRYLTVCAKAEDGEPTPANTKICCGDVLLRILNNALDDFTETAINLELDVVYERFYNNSDMFPYLFKKWINSEEFDALDKLWKEDKALFDKLRMEAIEAVLYSRFEADWCEESDRTTLFFSGRKIAGEVVDFSYGAVWADDKSWDEAKDAVVSEYLGNMFGAEAL